MESTTKVIVSLLMLAVLFGVGTQILTRPADANAVLAATAGTVTGVTAALEGQS